MAPLALPALLVPLLASSPLTGLSEFVLLHLIISDKIHHYQDRTAELYDRLPQQSSLGLDVSAKYSRLHLCYSDGGI